MTAIRRWARRTALLLLGALAFGQASLAAAACEMDRRSSLTQALAAESAQDGGCEEHATGKAPMSTSRCMAHCTADLQIHSPAGAAICGPAVAEALLMPQRDPPNVAAGHHFPPRVGIPVRILLHAFLV